MYVCMYIYIYLYTPIYIYIYIFIHACMHPYIHTSIHTVALSTQCTFTLYARTRVHTAVIAMSLMTNSDGSSTESNTNNLGVQGCAVSGCGVSKYYVSNLSPISGLRCEVTTPSVVEGQSITIFKPRILKHHIPELPNNDTSTFCKGGCSGNRV